MIVPSIATIHYSQGLEDRLGPFDGDGYLFRIFTGYFVILKVLLFFLVDGCKTVGNLLSFLWRFFFLSSRGFLFPAHQSPGLIHHKADDFFYSLVNRLTQILD